MGEMTECKKCGATTYASDGEDPRSAKCLDCMWEEYEENKTE